MTEKEMLLKIIDLQNEIILLMKKVSEKIPSLKDIDVEPSVSQDTCLEGKYHQYPNPWFGTIPSSCLKCGKPSDSYTTTVANLLEDEHGVYCGV